MTKCRAGFATVLFSCIEHCSHLSKHHNFPTSIKTFLLIFLACMLLDIVEITSLNIVHDTWTCSCQIHFVAKYNPVVRQLLDAGGVLNRQSIASLMLDTGCLGSIHFLNGKILSELQ